MLSPRRRPLARRIAAAAIAAFALGGMSLISAPVAHAAIGSYVSGHVLYINGDGASDLVDVTCVSGNVKVNGANPDDGAAPCAGLAGISVETLAGADDIDLSAVTASAFPKMNEPSIYSGSNDDTITTSPVGTFANAGDGNDTLIGRGGPDRLTGGAGTDDVQGGGGGDSIGGYLSPGVTTLSNTQLVNGAETDTLSSIERAVLTVVGPTYDGSAFDGRQWIQAGNTVAVTAGAKNDTLEFAGGHSGSFDGGPGTDTVEIQAYEDVNLDPGQVTTAGGTYTLASIERGYVYWQAIAPSGGTVDARDWATPLRYENWSPRKVTFLGGHASDRATGGNRRDILKGFDGNDTLLGKGGKDTLIGGRGRDVCTGGPGADSVRGCEA
ncbi:MAG TPA: hypothetical protein VFR44_08415 [Actinomycetota bacterium]|nr:hypothetical protein [Actinomycetota bacterium]